MSEVCTWCGVEWGVTNMRCINGRLHHTPAASVADTCKCGHSKTLHGPFECDKCNCTAYTPAAAPEQAAPAWLDAPDGDGWWWRYTPGAKEVVRVDRGDAVRSVHYEAWSLKDEMPNTKWQPVVFPTPPAPPLPRSRTVTLTATRLFCSCGGKVEIRADDVLVKVFHDSDYESTKDGAAGMVRASFGVEVSES